MLWQLTQQLTQPWSTLQKNFFISASRGYFSEIPTSTRFRTLYSPHCLHLGYSPLIKLILLSSMTQPSLQAIGLVSCWIFSCNLHRTCDMHFTIRLGKVLDCTWGKAKGKGQFTLYISSIVLLMFSRVYSRRRCRLKEDLQKDEISNLCSDNKVNDILSPLIDLTKKDVNDHPPMVNHQEDLGDFCQLLRG